MSETKKNKISLLKILMILSVVVWLGVVMATVYFLPDIPKTSENDVRKVIMQDTSSAVVLEYNKGKLVPGVEISEILEPSDELIELGRKTYKESCASCHGDEGKGDGAGGAMLTPKPRNFLKSTDWVNGQELSSMFKTLAEGIPGSGMNAYEFLPVKTRFALIYYIRTFSDDYPIIIEESFEQIDQIYDITKQTKAGASVPIEIAMKKVVLENKENIDKYLSLLESSNFYGKKFFNNYSIDKIKAVRTLLRNDLWKNNLDDFYKVLAYNSIENGFSEDVYFISRDDLEVLQQFIKTSWQK